MNFVEWDDDLPHQIRLVFGVDKSGKMYNAVSCTCMATKRGANISYEPLVEREVTVAEAKELFNDPQYHREHKGEAFRA